MHCRLHRCHYNNGYHCIFAKNSETRGLVIDTFCHIHVVRLLAYLPFNIMLTSSNVASGFSCVWSLLELKIIQATVTMAYGLRQVSRFSLLPLPNQLALSMALMRHSILPFSGLVKSCIHPSSQKWKDLKTFPKPWLLLLSERWCFSSLLQQLDITILASTPPPH